jgi:hypothetical protein
MTETSVRSSHSVGSRPGSAHYGHWGPLSCLLCLIALACGAAADVGFGQDATSPRIRRVLVPAGKPELWPQGEWHPLSRADYEALLRSEQPQGERPVSTWIARAAYSAKFSDGMLQDGLLTAQVEFSGTKPELLNLEPLNIAVSELHWADADATDGSPAASDRLQEDAIWGATPDGETALLVDRPSGQLQGRWTLRGRRLPRSIEFDLQVMPATVSQIEIRLPADRVLRSSAGHVVGPLPTDEPGWTRWRVELGTRTNCRLMVAEKTDAPRAEPVVLVRQDVKYVVRAGGLLIDRADFYLEAFEAPVRDLTFTVPAEMEIYGITYGTETTLAWNRTRSGDVHELSIQLPDPLLGSGRPIRIRGNAPLKLHQAWTLPSITLRDAKFLSGKIAVGILPPFELRAFRAPGCRQQEPETSDGRSLAFHQYLPEGHASLEIGYPRLTLAASVLTHAVVDSDNWSLKWEVQWRANAGSTFTTRCRIPRGWEITAVQQRPQSSGTEYVGWSVKRNRNQRILVLEFLNALRSEQQKTVLISARRLPRQSDQSAGLPLLEPLDCEDVETLVAVSHPPTAAPVLRPDTQFDAVPERSLPAMWQELALWNEIRASGATKFFVPVTRPLPRGGQLVLRQTQRLLKGTALVVATLEQNAIHQEFVIQGEPGADPVDRALVFLSSGGSDLSWELAPDRVALEARRIDSAQHADWNLPEQGELWEVYLPAPQRARFQVSARRTLPWSEQFTPTLAVVPQSQTFQGFLELNVADGLLTHVSRNELQAVGVNEIPTGLKKSESRRTAPVHAWQYGLSPGTVEMELQATVSARSLPQTASMSLRTRIAPGKSGYDLHEVIVAPSDHAVEHEFEFQLPGDTELISIRVNNRQVSAARRGAAVVLPCPRHEPLEQVEIRYRTPVEAGFAWRARRVKLPRLTWEIVDFDWELTVPPGLRLATAPEGVSLAQPLPHISRFERMFGPLGRSAYEPVFNPLAWESWTGLFRSLDRPTKANDQSSDDESVHSGWTVWRSSAPRVPDTLRLELWDRTQLTSLGWLALVVCLAAGLLFRMTRARWRVPLGVCWLSLCLACTWWAPPVYAELIGGCLSGSLIAGLLPRRLLRPLTNERPSRDNDSLGSTATYHHASASLALLGVLVLGGTVAALAQERPQVAPHDLRNSPAAGVSAANAQFDVLLPVDSDERTDDTLPVVWVGPELLARARELNQKRPDLPEYLLMSADYHGDVDEQHNVVLRAKFRMAVLTQRDSVLVYIPVVNAHLGGPDACRVNGAGHTILQDPSNRGFIIELKRTVSVDGIGRADLNRLPLTENAPSSRPLRSGVEVFDVELELYPPIQALPAGGQLRIGIPSVLASRLALSFPQSVHEIEFPEARGAVRGTTDASTSAAHLGKVEQLRAAWSQEAGPVKPPVALAAEVVRAVQINPTWLQFRYRVNYQVLGGPVDFVSWRVPREITVREGDVQVAGLPAHTRLSQTNQGTQLIIEFPQPQTDDFVVEAAFIAPVGWTDDRVVLPEIELHDENTVPVQSVDVLNDYLGVSTAPGFRLSSLNEMDESDEVTRLATETFLRRWGEEAGTRRPHVDLAYRVKTSAKPAFQIVALPPLRKVRMYQEGRIGKQRLEWTLRGEIETTQAPAFQHALTVDPRLSIDSISVQEDGAERRARWSRTDDGVLLFLKDKTIGTQNIVLNGSMPLQLGGETALPTIRLEDAELADSRLLLYHAAEVLVQLGESAALTPLDSALDGGENGDKGVLLGQYRMMNASPPPQIRTATRDGHALVDSVTVLEQQDDQNWTMATTLRFRILDEQPGNLHLSIPPELAANSQLHVTDATHTETPLPDGARRITLKPVASTTGDFSATVIGTLSKTRGEMGPLPHIAVLNATSGANYLILAPGKILQALAPLAESLSAEALPSWVRDTPAFDLDNDDFDSYLGRSSRWRLNLVRPVPVAESARLLLIDTQIRLDQGTTSYARTTMHMTTPGTEPIELDWPEDADLRALFIDGRPVAFDPPASGLLRIPAGGRAGQRTVVLLWARPAREWVGWQWRDIQVRLPFPVPRNIPTDRSLFAIAPPPHLHLRPHHDVVSLDAAAYLLDRLEALLDVFQFRRDRDFPIAEQDWQALRRIEQRLRRRFPQTEEELDRPPESLEQRFATAVPLIEALRQSIPESGFVEVGDSAHALSLQQDLATASVELDAALLFGRLTSQDAPVPIFWRVDRRSIAGLFTVFGLVVLGLIVRKVFQWKVGEWLDARRPLAVAALAVIWWAWLTPSVVGFLLVGLVFVQVVRRRLSVREPRHIVING